MTSTDRHDRDVIFCRGDFGNLFTTLTPSFVSVNDIKALHSHCEASGAEIKREIDKKREIDTVVLIRHVDKKR